MVEDISGFRCANGDITRPPPRLSRRGLSAGLAALTLILLAPAGAVAADMPELLRGSYSPSYTRWDGFYFGGQAGKTWGSADFGNADNSLVSYMLANTELQSIVTNFTTLPKGSTGSTSYGGFVGYNWQWDDVVLGGELNYNHMSIGIGAQDSTDPVLITSKNPPPGFTLVYNVSVTSGASVAIHDIVTARTRAGWTFDRFLPYGFVGVAVGRADVSRYATLGNSTEHIYNDCERPRSRAPRNVCVCRVIRNRKSQSGLVALWLYRRARSRRRAHAKSVCSRRMGVHRVPQY